MRSSDHAVSRRRFAALLAGWAAAQAAAAGSDSFASNFDGSDLRDQSGRTFDFARLAGRVLLVNFVFTGCSSVCPVQTHALAQVMAGLPPDVRPGVHFVSVSLDPLSDTPAALLAYAKRFSLDLTRWSLVTGAPAAIGRVADRLRLFGADRAGRRPDDHATTLWLVNAGGHLVQRLHGQPLDERRVSRELTVLRRMA